MVQSETKQLPTACNLCYANCGILATVDENNILKVRGDKNHPASQGYLCNKASRINYYQNGKDRLSSPLRKRPDGSFEEIDWDTAVKEIAGRLMHLKESFGGDKIMYYGGGGQGNHMGPMHGSSTLRALGVRLRSNALAQEKTGLAWTSERMLGGYWHADFEECEVALLLGKNAWQTNGFQRARVTIQAIAKDPDRTLVVFDPRKTETAELADIHLAVNPGTDTWCIAAILGYMSQNDLLNVEWLEENTNGYEQVLEQLDKVPVEEFAEFSGIPMDQIIEVATALGATDKVGVYEDVGIEMAPNSTLCSYLNVLLFALRGSFANEGGMHLVKPLVSIFGYGAGSGTVNDQGFEEGFRTSPATGARIVCGLLPCNSMAEEILADHPDRIRAMIVESGNPAHSVADSQLFREACGELDTLVVIDVALTETAQLADYVLPAASQYEKAEATFFNFEYPDNFFHIRHPLFKARAGTLTEAEIHARIIEEFGVFGEGELDELRVAAESGLEEFSEVFLEQMRNDKRLGVYSTYVLYRTLGPSLPGQLAEAAPMWLVCQDFANRYPEDVKRAGHKGDGVELGNALFKALLDSPSGAVVGTSDVADDPHQWRKDSGRLELGMAEMLEEFERLTEYNLPVRADEFPFLLVAGERRLYTANTAIRDPAWMKSNNPTALAVHPEDAKEHGISDAAYARIVTKRSSAEVIVEYDDRMKRGTISIPNGLGLTYPDSDGNSVTFGISPNELTDVEDRDPFVGTPWHKHVRAKLEPLQRAN